MFRLSKRGSFALLFALMPMLLQPITIQNAAAAITTAACRDTFGTPGNVSVSVTGNDCVIKFNDSSTWGIPTGVTSVRVLLVGGGAAGYIDGGGGGGGGGGLAISSLTVAAGTTANIVVGGGGNADNLATLGGGGQSKLDTNNDGTFDWTANGGTIGGNWTSRVGGTAGSASVQGSATVLTGGSGGAGPTSATSGQAAASGGSNGFQSDITGTNYYYGGGGGGGIGSHSNNSPSTVSIGYADGGQGGGGAGAAQRTRNASVTWTYTGGDAATQSLTAYCEGNDSYPGTTVGFNGRDGYGGGGGGGSAYGDGCTPATNTSYDGERNRGGFGGRGVVIIRYTPDVTAPVITGPNSATGATSSISISENTTSVFTFSANESVTWAKSGADQARFTLTGSTLTITARDFETPQSTLSSNVYVVILTATDISTNSASQTLSVTITNVNEAPVIGAFSGAENATYSVAENTGGLYNINATDVDAGTTLTYSLTGTDANDFSISGTGGLAFNPAADFEAPTDSDGNNTYVVVTWVSDGALSDSQTVTITVTNSNESGSLGTPTLSATPYKGISVNLSVSINAAGKVRFLVGNKRIPNCLAVSATGSGSTFTATCAWKPASTGMQNLTASFTPSSGTFTSATSPTLSVRVFKRTTTR